jgi:hypothetical protein
MSEPPNFRDVSKCCGNCDDLDMIVDSDDIVTGVFICGKYLHQIDHPAYLCDDWRNE